MKKTKTQPRSEPVAEALYCHGCAQVKAPEHFPAESRYRKGKKSRCQECLAPSETVS